MTVETALYPSQFNTNWPQAADMVSEGDNHIRLIKTVDKTTWPNVAGAVSASHIELNYVTGVTSGIQSQMNTKGSITGQTWTGAHVFSGSVAVPTLAQATSTTGAASTAFVQAEWAARMPNYTAPITASTTELNRLVGVTSGIQAQINTKGAIAGQTWTGTHDFTAATATGATQTTGDSSTKFATTAFVAATALATALPGQAGNSGKVITTDGTNASWTDTLTAIKFAALNGGQLAGFRNKAHNGIFAVNQERKSGTVTLAAGAFGHDRWKAGASGCTYTFATAAGITTLTITAGSLLQVVDGASLRAGTHILSWTGTAQGRIAAGSYGATGVTGTVTAGTNINIEFNTGTVTNVMFEEGTTATPYEFRSTQMETLICQHYFWRFDNLTGNKLYGYAGTPLSTTRWIGPFFSPPVPMRAQPTVTHSSLICTIESGGTAGSVTSISVYGGTNTAYTYDVTIGTANLTVGNVAFMGLDANGWFALDARI